MEIFHRLPPPLTQRPSVAHDESQVNVTCTLIFLSRHQTDLWVVQLGHATIHQRPDGFYHLDTQYGSYVLGVQYSTDSADQLVLCVTFGQQKAQ